MLQPASSLLDIHRPGLEIYGPTGARDAEVLSGEALGFVAGLAGKFGARVGLLLEARDRRQARFDAGELPDFRADTRHIREAEWRVGAIPADLLDRRVEITGPVD